MSVWDITGLFGVTPDIAEAVLEAELDPTSANVKQVFKAYAANGQTPPAKLVAHLIAINEERHPEDTFRSATLPYLIGGLAVLFFLFRR